MGSAPLSRLITEAIGTAVLVFFGIGGLLVAGAGAVSIAGGIAMFFAAAVAMWVFKGHLNPWITVGSAVRGSTPWADVPALVVAQLVGGLAGGLALWGIYGNKGLGTAPVANHLAGEVSAKNLATVLAAEAIAVFVLCLVYFAAGDSDRGPIATALAYGVATFTLIGVSTASMNFARTLGVELTLLISGGNDDWSKIWIFVVGPLIGAVVAGLVHSMVTAKAEATA
jgi:glycerol uptake facilitator protein